MKLFLVKKTLRRANALTHRRTSTVNLLTSITQYVIHNVGYDKQARLQVPVVMQPIL